MKKIYLSLLIFSITLSSIAQTTYWTSYNFSIDPENVESYINIADEHFKNNTSDGVTTYLYENHISDSNNNYTHSIILAGSLEAMGALYDSPQSKEWELFFAKINHFTESFSSAMGNRTLAFNNGDKPVQKYYFLDVADPAKYSAAFKKYAQYRPKSHQALFGATTSGHSPEGESHWIIIGFDDFKSAIEGNSYRNNNPAAQKAWEEYRGNRGDTKLVRSGLRIMLRKW